GKAVFDAALQWTMGAPDGPFSVWASVASGQITINWDAAPGATRYTVLKSTTGAPGSFTAILAGTNVTGTSFVDTGLIDGITYYYQVIALNGFAQSAPSSVLAAAPQPVLTRLAIT